MTDPTVRSFALPASDPIPLPALGTPTLLVVEHREGVCDTLSLVFAAAVPEGGIIFASDIPEALRVIGERGPDIVGFVTNMTEGGGAKYVVQAIDEALRKTVPWALYTGKVSDRLDFPPDRAPIAIAQKLPVRREGDPSTLQELKAFFLLFFPPASPLAPPAPEETTAS